MANSDGVLATDDQVRTRFAVTCVASGDTGLQTGMEAPGRTIGFEFFDEHPPEEIARIAAARAVGKLAARPAPSGKVPVVLRRGRRWRAVPRGVRARARGRPREP